MANLNKVFLMGNLTRDPELRYTPSGTAIASFGLAVNRKWKGQDGQQHEEVTFIDVDAFGRQAEVISEYMAKGKPIFVEGRLKLDQWDDKATGQKRSKIKVTLEGFQFIGAPGGKNAEGAPQQGGPKAARPAARGEEDLAAGDEDIPF